MKAYWPGGTIADKSFRVMDTTRFRNPFGAVDTDPPIVDQTGGYSIEIFFPAIPTADMIGSVDSLLATINTALGNTTLLKTFLTGYFSLRFTGPTRAYLGMQQWSPTCSLEISALPGVNEELDLYAAMLSPIYDALPNPRNPLPHWGQMLDSASLAPENAHFDVKQGYGDRYPNYTKWQQVYAQLSNNFTVRTFENDLSARWQLTYPPQTMTAAVSIIGKQGLSVQAKVTVTNVATGSPVEGAIVTVYDEDTLPPMIKGHGQTGADGVTEFTFMQCVDPETKTPVTCGGRVRCARYKDIYFETPR